MISSGQTSHLSWDVAHYLSLLTPIQGLIGEKEGELDIGSAGNIVYLSNYLSFFLNY